MSFTAEVKDELARVDGPTQAAQYAQLSAIMRVCGTLSFRGPGRYSIKIATETGAVARTAIKLTHKLFDLETSLTVRRSVLHKTRNYLIETRELVALISSFGAGARLNHRRGAYAIYLKSYEDITALLRGMGAERVARVVEIARAKKSVKNDVNRRVNAEMANQARSTGAAADQLELIEEAERLIGMRSLPPALRAFCEVRRANPELSLAALGQEMDPPASKSAMYHRVLRLQQLVDEAKTQIE